MVNESSNMTLFIKKAAIIFVVIVVGVAVGMAISIETGLTAKLMNGLSLELEFANRTKLHEGDAFPLFVVFDENGESLSVDQYLSGSRTLVAFVSNGCTPCHLFIDHLQALREQETFNYEILLLSIAPDFFIENHDLPVFRVEPEILDEYELHKTPTLIVVDGSLKLRAVASGYSRELLERIIRYGL